jgi:bifunctional non-homologous end joining protein LigD
MASRCSLAPELPRFIGPMLARPGCPFDSDAFLFEVKWDGTRALAFRDGRGYRLVNRRRAALTDRYPECAPLAGLPPGTVVDGEVVVLRDGRPDFGRLQSRDQARRSLTIRMLARARPAAYVVFDLLYEAFRSVMGCPLEERRARLRDLVARVGSSCLVLSEGVRGHGRAFFQEACRLDLEGVMAKRLRSRYVPGRRTGAWIKIKKASTALCAVLGFVPVGRRDFRSLILAAEADGALRWVGHVGTGWDAPLRARLNGLLWPRVQATPLIPCPVRGRWVRPGLWCTVKYLERTAGGAFRDPVFEALYEA